jgi:ribonuclease-3
VAVEPDGGADRLERRLGHRFSDPTLRELALTHRSRDPRQNNERLEFLGDAVLGAVIAEELFRRFPRARENDLTLARSRLVRGETLAEVARTLELGPHVRLGPGERASGGRDRSSILADALEALYGAVFLDGGHAAVEQVIRAHFEDQLARAALVRAEKDAKTRLQEWLQARGRSLPAYTLEAEEGASHARRFRVACAVDGETEPTRAEGTSRRRAEQRAAARMLERLGERVGAAS